MFHSGTLLRTITQETASQTSLRSCSNKVMEEPGYIGVFVKKQKPEQTYIVEHQKITTNHKQSRHLSFSAFNGCVFVSQSYLILCNPMDYSLPGSSVHGILQTRILEYSLLQGIFPNLGLPHLRQILYGLSHQGSPSLYGKRQQSILIETIPLIYISTR